MFLKIYTYDCAGEATLRAQFRDISHNTAMLIESLIRKELKCDTRLEEENNAGTIQGRIYTPYMGK